MSEEHCLSCGKTNPPGTPKCQCGRPLPAGPEKPIEAAPAPDAMIPKTVIRRVNPQEAAPPKPSAPAEGMSLPMAGHSQQEFLPNNPTPMPAGPATEPPRSVARSEARRTALVNVAWAILVFGGLAVAGSWYRGRRQAAQRPEIVVPRLAAQYLAALAQNDFAGAYGMFSQAAQAQSSLDEFRQLRDTTPWTWSNISVVSVEPDAVLIQYDLALEGRPPRKDYLFFVQQNGQWVRPYNWGLLKKIETAFDRSDPDMAMLLAQAAVNVDARDPMARGYLCEALYYRKLPDQAAQQCEEALVLAKKYPSRLTPKSLYHLYAILGDTYKNSLKLYGKAADDYGTMLGFPELSADDQCELLLARADAFSKSSNNQGAAADLASAAAACTKPEDQQFIARRRAELQH